MATGYLKGEYRALGVDFTERNDLFDEAIEMIRGVWSTDDFAYDGRHFTAHGQTANPKPAVMPPLWIGGNSQLSRRRVAQLGDGWKPFPAPRATATTAKTPQLETTDHLTEMLGYLWRHVESEGRDRSEIDVCFGTGAGGHPGRDGFEPDAKLEGIDELSPTRGHLERRLDPGRLARSGHRRARRVRGRGHRPSVKTGPLSLGRTVPVGARARAPPRCSG